MTPPFHMTCKLLVMPLLVPILQLSYLNA
jgi:hypothetical protein